MQYEIYNFVLFTGKQKARTAKRKKHSERLMRSYQYCDQCAEKVIHLIKTETAGCCVRFELAN